MKLKFSRKLISHYIHENLGYYGISSTTVYAAADPSCQHYKKKKLFEAGPSILVQWQTSLRSTAD